MSVLNELIQFLKIGRKQKLAIFCVGNILKADDGLGPVIAENLTDRIDPDILLVDVGSQPENFVSILKRNKVTHCLLIDATNFEAKPGQIITKDNFSCDVNSETDLILFQSQWWKFRGKDSPRCSKETQCLGSL